MSTPQVQFITKESGCSLCDDAWVELEAARDYAEFDIEVIKIRPGDPYYNEYWDKIPVILINGKIAFKYRTTRDQILRKLKGRRFWQFWK